MTHDNSKSHLSAETMQAFLEGELSRQETTSTEEHLASCSRCAAELDGWRVLFEDLGDLSSHRPHEGFHDRVMARVEVPDSVSLGARVLGRIEEFTASAHVAPDVMQDFIEGSLAARRGERVEAHLAACADCSSEADAWLGVMRRLDELPSFAPGDGFSERVLAGITVPETPSLAARLREGIARLAGRTPEHVPTGLLQDLVDGALPARAVALRPAWSRGVAAAWRLVPQTREALAAMSGVAVTPVVIVGLMAYAVFSHPALTVGSLLSFAWWQVSDLASGALATLSSAVLQNSDASGVSSLFEMLAAAPILVAGGVILYTMASAFAVRVLWKNLHAHASSVP
ncbi:MAG: anti-sigma factor family protein [Longimicrobiales bacterium]